jgi:hypothetical protein
MDEVKDLTEIKLLRKGQGSRRANWFVDAANMGEGDLSEWGGPVGSKRVVKAIRKDDFLLSYLKDLREVFGLSDGQIRLLLALTSSYSYKGKFEWTADSISHVAKLSGLSNRTVINEFSYLVSKKGLVRKIKNQLYELNDKVLFHRGTFVKAAGVQVTLVYKFEDGKPSIDSLLEKGTEVSIEMVEAMVDLAENQSKQAAMLRELYNEQQKAKLREEKAAREAKAAKEEYEKKMKSNKWE